MSGNGTAWLMYHELQCAGRELCVNEPGYVRYVIQREDFRAQVAWLKQNHWRGMSVSEGLRDPRPEGLGVVITFDDGCETDLIAAAPLLKETGFGATFYVVVGWLGRPGWLSHTQVRELAGIDFEIGCHSMTHAYLTHLTLKQLRSEVSEAKERLEQIVGQRVDHFSCPGGRWDSRVAQVAREAGYLTVATSREGINSPASNPYCLSRLAILRGTTISEFGRLCRGQGLLKRRAKQRVLGAIRRLLGNTTYERIRSATLGE
jgi:peptidoglycan/xylan/chitin deacetylase (PgdA/CDA1 family)